MSDDSFKYLCYYIVTNGDIMPCKLGLDNEEKNKEHYGGIYTGESIAKKVGQIRRQLEADGLTEGKVAYEKRPFIYVSLETEEANLITNNEAILLTDIFEDNSLYRNILCGGFGGGDGNGCIDCPYLQKKSSSDSK